MTAMCPHCGYNLKADEPLERGDWRVCPRTGIFYRGALMTKRPAWVQIVLTLLKAEGRIVSREVLHVRCSEGEYPATIKSQMYLMRRFFREQAIEMPIENVPSLPGWRWKEAA